MQPRAGAVRLEPDRDARAAGRNRLAARVAVREHEAFRRVHFDDLAGRFRAVRITNPQLSSRPRVDRRAGAPPGRPARLVGEETKDVVGGWLEWRPCDRGDGAVTREAHVFLLSSLLGRRPGWGRGGSARARPTASAATARRSTCPPASARPGRARPDAPDRSAVSCRRGIPAVRPRAAPGAEATPRRTSRPASRARYRRPPPRIPDQPQDLAPPGGGDGRQGRGFERHGD